MKSRIIKLVDLYADDFRRTTEVVKSIEDWQDLPAMLFEIYI
jgi:hypothetical protein